MLCCIYLPMLFATSLQHVVEQCGTKTISTPAPYAWELDHAGKERPLAAHGDGIQHITHAIPVNCLMTIIGLSSVVCDTTCMPEHTNGLSAATDEVTMALPLLQSMASFNFVGVQFHMYLLTEPCYLVQVLTLLQLLRKILRIAIISVASWQTLAAR
ncbi:hypothetical protein C8Q73DRAFT_97664 [Cubamyces lactineus]|nr:hypothetical protein C8Q73DRAFT_97664 [Cubamyces lactineus]